MRDNRLDYNLEDGAKMIHLYQVKLKKGQKIQFVFQNKSPNGKKLDVSLKIGRAKSDSTKSDSTD